MRFALPELPSWLLYLAMTLTVGESRVKPVEKEDPFRCTDLNSKLFWDIEITGGPVTSGQYVMGEPWIVLGAGQTAVVRHVGRWSILPNTNPSFPAGVVDATYGGPRTLDQQFPNWRHGTMLNPRGGGTLDTSGTLTHSRTGYDARVGAAFDPALYHAINDTGHPGLAVVPGDTLVSTVSNPENWCTNCRNPGWTDIWAHFNGDPCAAPPGGPNGPSCSSCPTQWAGALSILNIAPPSGAFASLVRYTLSKRSWPCLI